MKLKLSVLLSSLFFLFAVQCGHAQITLSVDSVLCGATSTTLHAVLVGEDSATTGISVDDQYSVVTPIGFTFNYYGTNYNKLVIGGNGELCFDTTRASAFNPWQITGPLLGNTDALATICGPWCDVDITFGGNITYSTIGRAPNRRFIATWCRTAMFYCNYQYLNTQIILYEGTNNIEVHIGHKDTCQGWNDPGSPYGIVGVQDRTGTYATTAPSRDFPTVWTATREAWRFIQTSATSYSVSSITYAPVPYSYSPISWYDAATNAYLGTGPTLSVTPAGASRYYATAAGCGDSTITYIDVNLPDLVYGGSGVHASFTVDVKPGCKGDSVIVKDNSYPAGYTSIWDFGDGTPLDSALKSDTHVYASQGTYSIVLEYHDATGCKDTAMATVNFNHPLSAFFTPTPNAVCIGKPVNFVNTSAGNQISSYWSFGDGDHATDSTPTHNYSIGGHYVIKLTVTDSLGCVATHEDSVNVLLVKLHLGFEDTTVCLRDSMQLNASVTVEPNVYSQITYQWTPSIGIQDDTIPNPKFFGRGDFYQNLIVIVLPLGCFASASEHIISEPPLQLTNVTASTTIPYGSSIQLNALGGYYFVWTPNNGTLNDPNINNPIATPLDSVTRYTVIGMTKYGCKDTAYVDVRTVQDTFFVMPSAFTPNDDGRNDVFRPYNLKFQKLVEFKIFNRWGTEIYHSTDPNKGWDGTYNGEKLDLGVYYYSVILAQPNGTQKNYSGDVTLIR